MLGRRLAWLLILSPVRKLDRRDRVGYDRCRYAGLILLENSMFRFAAVTSLILIGLLVPVVGLADTPDGLWSAAGNHGAVASGSREATDAGLAMLQSGGNAADAAAATILTLSVTDSGNFCFGGEVPIIVYDQQRHSTEVLSGQGSAPRLATREQFATKETINSSVQTAAVPAALDAVLTLLDRAGTRSFSQASDSMLRVLDRHEKDW